MTSVLNDWVHELTYMQQSVLLAMVRNADGIGKHHPQKELIKWFRRCILKSAFDGRHMTAPHEPGGGSFTGPVENIHEALNQFIWARDEMTLHYFLHAMHAFEILGYKYPNAYYRKFWYDAYVRMVHACHMTPETEYDMDKRLCDNIETWQAREDCAGGCTSTERKDLVDGLKAKGVDPLATATLERFNKVLDDDEQSTTWSDLKDEALALGDELDVRSKLKSAVDKLP